MLTWACSVTDTVDKQGQACRMPPKINIISVRNIKNIYTGDEFLNPQLKERWQSVLSLGSQKLKRDKPHMKLQVCWWSRSGVMAATQKHSLLVLLSSVCMKEHRLSGLFRGVLQLLDLWINKPQSQPNLNNPLKLNHSLCSWSLPEGGHSLIVLSDVCSW